MPTTEDREVFLLQGPQEAVWCFGLEADLKLRTRVLGRMAATRRAVISEGSSGATEISSLLTGLLMFASLYAFVRWAPVADPQILSILLNSSKFRSRYDPANQALAVRRFDRRRSAAAGRHEAPAPCEGRSPAARQSRRDRVGTRSRASCIREKEAFAQGPQALKLVNRALAVDQTGDRA